MRDQADLAGPGGAIWAQIIDDSVGRTLVSAGSINLTEKGLSKTDQAAKVGELLAERAKAAGVERVLARLAKGRAAARLG